MTADPGTRRRIAAVFGGLIAANAAAWAWALAAFHATPVLLGTALLAYGLGLRHAVDADHIAAIDNVTRSLMQTGQRPVGVGLFFSLGHSTIVIAASAAIALAAQKFGPHLHAWHDAGGVIGTLVSVAFLFAIAAANLLVLRTLRRARTAGAVEETTLDQALSGRGPLSRLLRPLFAVIGQSWHMYPLGLLFGLGFDTATEVALLGLSATEATRHLPILAVMVFPALFTAGMALVDTADGVLMLGAYGWAFIEPARKLTYNMAVTMLSVVVALLVGGIEAAGLISDRFSPDSGLLDDLGYGIVAVFAASWGASVLITRMRRGEIRP